MEVGRVIQCTKSCPQLDVYRNSGLPSHTLTGRPLVGLPIAILLIL